MEVSHLDKVTAEADVTRNSAFKVDGRALLKLAEVGTAEGFGCYADLEAVLVELGDGEAGSWVGVRVAG